MFREPENPFDVEMIENRVAQLHLGERKLFSQLIALTFVRLPVNRPLV